MMKKIRSRSVRSFHVPGVADSTIVNHFDIPVRTIWIATVATIKPVILIRGPIAAKRSNVLLIQRDDTIITRLITRAMVRDTIVITIPWDDENEMAAVIVPGPAIKGAPNGTTEISSEVPCESFS